MADVQLPEFIEFLFSQKPKMDCHFIVGNQSQVEPERIGAVKLMLMAHSEVMRRLLEDSDIKEKEDVKVVDIHPQTFKSMLQYVYGHDTTKDMSFDEADNLLYVAEKYLMRRLKDKVLMTLMCLLSPDNICSLLNNPVCYTQLELNSAITKILQYDTEKVLANPQFLGLSPEGFLKILEQEGLAVPEIEVWRAAIKWAKHRAGTEDGKALRKQISAVEGCIRVCTLTPEQFCSEVVITDILSTEEKALVCESIGGEKKQNSLTTFCNEVEPRKRLFRTKTKYSSLQLPETNPTERDNLTFKFEVVTKKYPIEFCNLYCTAKELQRTEPEGWKYKVDCTITIREVTNPHILHDSSGADHEGSPMIIRFSELVELGKYFIIPLAIDRKFVTMLPKSKYSITMSFSGTILRYCFHSNNVIVEDNYLLLAVRGSYSPVRLFSCYAVVPSND